MLEFVRPGCYVFDYGNNLRGEAREGGLEDAFTYPGFVPAYIRPLFCRGIGPFRWAALSGDPADIAAIDRELQALFPDDVLLQRWLELAPSGSRSRGCRRGSAGSATATAPRRASRSTSSCAAGEVTAPVVIGRDHLDSGSVASPYRETEAMRDGSDAIADWPILNALLNTAAGATWVSVHHGGGVGHRQLDPRRHGRRRGRHRRGGRAARARADGRSGHGRDASRRRRLRRGARRRRASGGLDLPSARSRERRHRTSSAVRRLLIRDLAQVASPAGTARRCAAGARRARGRRGRVRPLRRRRDRARSGAMRDLALGSTATSRSSTAAGSAPIPGLVDCHTHACFAGDRVDEFALRAGGATLRGAPRRGRRHPLDGPRDPRGRRGRSYATRRAGTARWMRAHGHDDLRGQVGLRARPRHGARAAARGRGRGRRPDVARRAHGAARVRRRRRVRRLPARGGPARCGASSPRLRTSSSSAAPSTPRRPAAT